MNLDKEIEEVKRTVTTDAYQMSIGEILNLYSEGDLIINPAFQRLFRWTLTQKSRFIESILLGIPIPSIFVFETAEGQWELIDGLQRVSTVLEFAGVLDPNRNGERVPPSCLEATTYLPSLHNAVWEKNSNIPEAPVQQQKPIGKVQQLAIKRSRIGVEILKRPSDPQTKYDLFQRLNSGGTVANPQELRNCVVVMVDEDAFNEIDRLANFEPFLTLTQINEDQKSSQRHLEYAMRFLVYRYIAYDGKLDVEEYIDKGIVRILTEKLFTNDVKNNFRQTFELILESVGGDGLKRYSEGNFRGRVGLTALETIAVGISANLGQIQKLKEPNKFVERKIVEIWGQNEINEFGRAGLRGTQRIQRSLPYGIEWFRPQ